MLLRLYGENVTYTRGDLVISLRAVPTKPTAVKVDGKPVILNSKQLDWLIGPDDLKTERMEH